MMRTGLQNSHLEADLDTHSSTMPFEEERLNGDERSHFQDALTLAAEAVRAAAAPASAAAASRGAPPTQRDTARVTALPLIEEEAQFAFELPAGCWGIAIDDSNIQRKLLAKLLRLAGVAEERVSVVGGTAEEIYGFADKVLAHVRAHPSDYHLVIVDENLDIQQDCGGRVTVSGSMAIVTLREALHQEGLEDKLLAVVRSANDSSADIQVYRNRAHGLFLRGQRVGLYFYF